MILYSQVKTYHRIQTCQASRIWRERTAFYLYFTRQFPIHFLPVHAFSFQLLTIYFFKISVCGSCNSDSRISLTRTWQLCALYLQIFNARNYIPFTIARSWNSRRDWVCPPKTIPESNAEMLIILFYVLKQCLLGSFWVDRPSLSVSFRSR